MNYNSKMVTSNMFWRFLERFGAQGVTLIVSIVLARILDPVVYGTVALITVITTILQVFVDGGFGTALVQKKDSDNVDFSTVFYFNFIVCVVLYFILFFIAPLVASFYETDEMAGLIRVLGLVLIISGFKNIQNAYASKHLLFKKYFFATLGGTIVAAIVGIWMAYNGYGVWALVVQNVVNQAIDTVILWLLVKWRPQLVFSWKKLKVLFAFGWKLLLSALIDTTWNELRTLIIGKKYTKDDLAFYNKGMEYPKYATTAINSSVDSVLLPVMSSEQEDLGRVKAICRRSIKTSSFILWPAMIGLAACSKSFISVILTDKWLPSEPYLIIFCIVYAFYPIHTANLNAIKAVGRSDIFLILEILKKMFSLVIVLITMWFGVWWLAIGCLIDCVLGQVINAWPNKKLLNYSYIEQLKDIFPVLLLSAFMGVIVYLVNYINLSSVLTLIIQVSIGMIVYIAGAYIFKFESLFYCLRLVGNYFHKNMKNVTIEEKNQKNV